MNPVQNFEIFAPKLVDKKEYLSAGHRACQGCGEVLALRHILKALGDDIVVANATGCMEIISSGYPQTAWEVPYVHVAFENAAAVGSGVEAALKALRRKGRIADRDVKTIAVAGDGGTADIGLQALSGAMERGHDMIFFCLDNEAYMNTGIQRSSATPFMAATTTSPAGRGHPGPADAEEERPRDHGGPQGALRGHGLPELSPRPDQQGEKSQGGEGPRLRPRLLHVPHGLALRLGDHHQAGTPGRRNGHLPSLRGGERQVPAHDGESREASPRGDYLKPQGRFRHLGPSDIEKIQEHVQREWEILLNKVECMQPW